MKLQFRDDGQVEFTGTVDELRGLVKRSETASNKHATTENKVYYKGHEVRLLGSDDVFEVKVGDWYLLYVDEDGTLRRNVCVGDPVAECLQLDAAGRIVDADPTAVAQPVAEKPVTYLGKDGNKYPITLDQGSSESLPWPSE